MKKLLFVLFASVVQFVFAQKAVTTNAVSDNSGVIQRGFHATSSAPIVGDAAGSISGADAGSLRGTTLASEVVNASVNNITATTLTVSGLVQAGGTAVVPTQHNFIANNSYTDVGGDVMAIKNLHASGVSTIGFYDKDNNGRAAFGNASHGMVAPWTDCTFLETTNIAGNAPDFILVINKSTSGGAMVASRWLGDGTGITNYVPTTSTKSLAGDFYNKIANTNAGGYAFWRSTNSTPKNTDIGIGGSGGAFPNTAYWISDAAVDMQILPAGTLVTTFAPTLISTTVPTTATKSVAGDFVNKINNTNSAGYSAWRVTNNSSKNADIGIGGSGSAFSNTAYWTSDAAVPIQIVPAGTVAATFTATEATFTGNIVGSTAGKTLSVKSGTNALAGTVTLVAGAATITSTAIDVNTVIVFSEKTAGGTPGLYQPLAAVGAGSAAVTSAATDTSTYNWVALKVN